MKEALLNTIHDIYLGHNYQLFRSKCMNTPYYITELLNTSKSLCEDVTISHFVDWPSIELFCKFSFYKKDLFSVDYTTIIKISKISDIFAFQHEFSVENYDPNRMEPVLDGYSGTAYTMEQNSFEISLSKLLNNYGLEKITLSEMEEVVCDVPMPETKIFGPQMTVEYALFKDLYNICQTT